MNCLLPVDKPPGPTSHDVVDRVRDWAGTRRVGHLGTLDPAAEGLLLLCLGEALKAIPYLEDFDKEYEARLRLGVTTETQDLEGRVVSTAPVPAYSPAEMAAAFAPFHGEIDQIPPMYSALKVDGRKLVELARAGREVERRPRRVLVRELEIREIALPDVSFRAVVSRGTYLRTLCHDLGARLGCGAAMTALRRVRVGPFHVNDAVRLDDLPSRGAPALRPVLEALGHLPHVAIDAQEEALVRNGRRLAPRRETSIPGPDLAVGSVVALVRDGARLVAIARAGPEGLHPARVFRS